MFAFLCTHFFTPKCLLFYAPIFSHQNVCFLYSNFFTTKFLLFYTLIFLRQTFFTPKIPFFCIWITFFWWSKSSKNLNQTLGLTSDTLADFSGHESRVTKNDNFYLYFRKWKIRPFCVIEHHNQSLLWILRKQIFFFKLNRNSWNNDTGHGLEILFKNENFTLWSKLSEFYQKLYFFWSQNRNFSGNSKFSWNFGRQLNGKI